MFFKKPFLYGCLALILFVGVLGGVMFFISKPPSLNRNRALTTEQTKTGVVKEAFLVQPDGSCLHEYLSAKSSVFKLVKDQKKSDFIENLEGISAVLEEMVSHNGQASKQIRCLQADHGTWYYAGNRLTAEGAVMSVVEAQKSGLKPVFQGHADKLDMQLQEGKPQLTIEGFKAKLQKDKR